MKVGNKGDKFRILLDREETERLYQALSYVSPFVPTPPLCAADARSIRTLLREVLDRD